MKLSPNTKYTIFAGGFVVVFYLAYKFYQEATGLHSAADQRRLLITGFALLFAAAVTSVGMAYYKPRRSQVVGETEKGTELRAIATLTKHRTAPVSLELEASWHECDILEKTGTLTIRSDRFHQPYRKGDSIGLCVAESNHNRCVRGTITDISGVDQTVTIRRRI